jgi:hypothetical protein
MQEHLALSLSKDSKSFSKLPSAMPSASMIIQVNHICLNYPITDVEFCMVDNDQQLLYLHCAREGDTGFKLLYQGYKM